MNNPVHRASGNGLVVPIDVTAFCVGEEDQQEATGSFAGATTDYMEQYKTDNNAYLGENAIREFSVAPLKKLEKGVHLHWALPDSLTRADGTKDNVDFPAVPNRWLVTRLVAKNGIPVSKAWIIESDTLSLNRLEGQESVTLPVKTVEGGDKDFRYVGRYVEFSPGWTEPLGGQNEPFKTMTGSELNAVANGEITFAAYYPNSRSVFGFYDTLKDQDAGLSPLSLTYVVCGWYGSSSNDPLNKGLFQEDIKKLYKWSVNDKSTVFTYTVFNGFVQSVQWSMKTRYVLEQPSQLPIKAEAALGNSPAEALAAYFRNKNHRDIPLFEKLLIAFQNGLANWLSDPRPDQMSSLEKVLYQNEFTPVNAGYIYSIVKNDNARKESREDQTKELIELPMVLAEHLNLLNIYRQEYDQYIFKMNEYRWQLFADWYAIFKANPETKNAAFRKAYDRYNRWPDMLNSLNELSEKLNTQIKRVEEQLSEGTLLKMNPAPRYWQPNEPFLLLAGDDLVPPLRYGGDGRYTDDGSLICRMVSQVIDNVSVGNKNIDKGRFKNTGLETPNGLPFTGVFDGLVAEACLLNTEIGAYISGLDKEVLKKALEKELAGHAQDVYAVSGSAPSPVGVNWWNNNPWLPLFIEWTVEYFPLQPTTDGSKLLDYEEGFFTNNYSIDKKRGGAISYTPENSNHSIDVDPSKISFNQKYKGSAVLSATSVQNLKKQLDEYLKGNPDDTLEKIKEQLEGTNIMMQSLSGFNNSLLMRKQSLQLKVRASAGNDNEYDEFTQAVASVIGDMNSVSPDFNGYFNPVRAGYMKLSCKVIDAYGQKRDVEFKSIAYSESMTAYYRGEKVSEVAYLAPRISMPCRLLFRWISADSTGYDEMNDHPATTPICGWLLPNHLDGSLFLYSSHGKPLGTLYVKSGGTDVEWLSVPGNDQTADQVIKDVMKFENPQLMEFAVALKNKGADYFKKLWKSIDRANYYICPQNTKGNEEIAVLTGRPTAIVQASIKLELQGSPALNQSWKCFSKDGFKETDNNFTNIRFPVVLGDLKQVNDGLVGYFKENADGSGYNYGTFYSEAAEKREGEYDSNELQVVKPDQDNILVTPTPKPGTRTTSNRGYGARKVLMLIDPHTGIQAAMGIVPSKSIEIPPDQYVDNLSTLETTFLLAPVLKAKSGMAIPVPVQNGYGLSWIEEEKGNRGNTKWMTYPEIGTVTGKAVWEYSRQQISEGWLRLNPQLLEFNLANHEGVPAVINGAVNSLILSLVNKKGRIITITPALLREEGEKGTGSIFYIHFGTLCDQTSIPQINLTCPGWVFKCFNSVKYGHYWAASPSAGNIVSLSRDEGLNISMGNIKVSAKNQQVQVYFDYYGMDGINDGTFKAILTVTA